MYLTLGDALFTGEPPEGAPKIERLHEVHIGPIPSERNWQVELARFQRAIGSGYFSERISLSTIHTSGPLTVHWQSIRMLPVRMPLSFSSGRWSHEVARREKATAE